MSPEGGPAPSAVAVAVARLAELELRLVTDGRYDELEQLDDRRRQALDHLLARPLLAADRPVLVRAARVQATAAAALDAALSDVAAQLGQANKAKSAAHGYAMAARV